MSVAFIAAALIPALIPVLIPALTAAVAPAGFPFQDEALTYAVKWPSGLSLGEAKMSANKSGGQWMFNLMLDASVPGYVVKDSYRSTAGSDLCSSDFARETLHGTKKVSEKTLFLPGKAVRQTVGGGKTDIVISGCGHDALTLLFYARRELGQGRIPAAQNVIFGNEYQMKMVYAGAEVISVGSLPAQADHVRCVVSSKGTDLFKFEIYFARDAARTPLVVSVPFPLGAITMELVH